MVAERTLTVEDVYPIVAKLSAQDQLRLVQSIINELVQEYSDDVLDKSAVPSESPTKPKDREAFHKLFGAWKGIDDGWERPIEVVIKEPMSVPLPSAILRNDTTTEE